MPRRSEPGGLRWWLHFGPNDTPRMRYFPTGHLVAAIDKLLADLARRRGA